MRRLRIAIDIDDTLAANAEAVVAFSNQRWGTRLTVEDYTEHWAQMWRIDLEELERRAQEFYDSREMVSYGHIGDSREVLERLADRHHLMIATARLTQLKGDTLAWIEEHFPGIFASTAVYFADIWNTVDDHSHKMTKAELIQQINADVLVDDQLKHCLAVAERGRRAILFGDYAWNQANELPDLVERCISWTEVEAAIERLAIEGESA